MAKDDRNDKFWAVRDVPEHTRRTVKAYAADNGISMAEALEQLVDHIPTAIDWLTDRTPSTATKESEQRLRDLMQSIRVIDMASGGLVGIGRELEQGNVERAKQMVKDIKYYILENRPSVIPPRPAMLELSTPDE